MIANYVAVDGGCNREPRNGLQGETVKGPRGGGRGK